MKIVFVSNFMNHYQITLSDELYRLTNGGYIFIETTKLPESFKKNSGFVDFERDYIVRAWKNDSERQRAIGLAREADVVIGSDGRGNIPYIKDRLKNNKLTFDCSERPLKKGWINMFSPANIITQFYYHLFFYNKAFYKLCTSAYCANDLYRMHSFKDRCYKYGYFPKIEDIDVDEVIKAKKEHKHIKIIWCARFISWKHPEVPIILGRELKHRGYDFEINMIGTGELWPKMKEMIKSEGLDSFVHLIGAISNNQVLDLMREHDIFLFSSDRNEGWGVVLNEAMGQACCPVASDQIGATPFLLKHKNNGMIYKSGDFVSLVDSVSYLIDNPDKRFSMSKAAYEHVKDLWCPEVAAERLYRLMESLMTDHALCYYDGPLSSATPINTKVFCHNL